MCGIFGIASNKKNSDELKKICNFATKIMSHRGPDSNGTFVDKSIGLANTRLSILDIKNGNQPMSDKRSGLTIVFNGEIVNSVDLRKQIKGDFQHFLTHHSDTEIILKLYELYGEKCLNYLKGMFAFVIWDEKKNILFIARDHIGMKPLFYSFVEEGIIFASEISAIKSIKKEMGNDDTYPDEKLFNEYLVFGNIYGRNTPFKNIYALEPGHYAFIKNTKINIKKYWSPTSNLDEKINENNEEYIINKTKNLLSQVITEWKISDVQNGIFLSSGIDSNLIQHIVNQEKKLEQFTIKDENKDEDNEFSFMQKRLGINIKERNIVKLTQNYFADNIEKLIRHTAIPINNFNSLTFMALCEHVAKENGTRVIYIGDGADEIFGGYKRHADVSENYKKTKQLDTILLSKNYFTLDRMKLFDNSDIDHLNDRKKLYQDIENESDDINKTLINDQMTFLQGYLLRADQIGMKYGQEIRAPFCDERIISFVNSISGNLKINFANYALIFKYLLRKATEGMLDEKIIWKTPKHKFSSPISQSFFNGKLKELYSDNINNNSKLSSYYNIKGLKKLLGLHDGSNEMKNDHSNTLGRILALELWLKNFS